MLPSWEFGIVFLALPHSSNHLPFLSPCLPCSPLADSSCIWSKCSSSSGVRWTYQRGVLKMLMPDPLPEILV